MKIDFRKIGPQYFNETFCSCKAGWKQAFSEVSLKMVREILFPVVIRDFPKPKFWKRSLKCWNQALRRDEIGGKQIYEKLREIERN